MILRLVLDTSVALKWIRQGEVPAGTVLALRDTHLTGRITVTLTSLLAYELAKG